jgi:hypothetical protein
VEWREDLLTGEQMVEIPCPQPTFFNETPDINLNFGQGDQSLEIAKMEAFSNPVRTPLKGQEGYRLTLLFKNTNKDIGHGSRHRETILQAEKRARQERIASNKPIPS